LNEKYKKLLAIKQLKTYSTTNSWRRGANTTCKEISE
jgi:hypothetical protein